MKPGHQRLKQVSVEIVSEVTLAYPEGDIGTFSRNMPDRESDALKQLTEWIDIYAKKLVCKRLSKGRGHIDSLLFLTAERPHVYGAK